MKTTATKAEINVLFPVFYFQHERLCLPGTNKSKVYVFKSI